MADSPLHVSPQGVLGLLNLKQLGKNPDNFGEMLRGIVDLTSLYAVNYVRDVVRTTLSSGAIDAGPTVGVPASELWLLETLSGAAQLNTPETATDGFGVYVGYTRMPTTLAFGVTTASAFYRPIPPLTVTAFNLRCGGQLPRLIPLLPGSQIFARNAISLPGGSSATVAVEIDVYRIPY